MLITAIANARYSGSGIRFEATANSATVSAIPTPLINKVVLLYQGFTGCSGFLVATLVTPSLNHTHDLADERAEGVVFKSFDLCVLFLDAFGKHQVLVDVGLT
mgnify:CR=1 FL=1